MKVLLDTNIVLDVLLDRKPFVIEAAKLFSLIEEAALTGILCSTTITTIHYLATKAMGAKNAHKQIEKLLQLFDIAAVNRTVIVGALQSRFPDFEDAVVYEAARHNAVDIIITRDKTGFKKTSLKIYTPKEMLSILSLIN